MKVAVVHYWWMTNRGGEAVVKSILELYPEADLYLLVCDKETVVDAIGPTFKGKVYTSFIARLPFAKRWYQKYLALMPIALEQWDLSTYDLIISSEAGPAKGVLTRPDSIHICYCHSPMRYIWDMYPLYMSKSGFLVKFSFSIISHWLRVWDRASADRVDYFICNSNYIKSRVKKFYRRDSEVIFPPVNTSAFFPERPRGDYYLYLGQLVSYKRADLAVIALTELGLPLVVIGEGECLSELRSMAGANVKFLGRQPSEVVRDHLERCRALVFPGTEDFGIVPVEAMAAGAPVIAYGAGGVLDTVIDGRTGLLFPSQSVESLKTAVLKIENGEVKFEADVLRKQALRFDVEVFKSSFSRFIKECQNSEVR